MKSVDPKNAQTSLLKDASFSGLLEISFHKSIFYHQVSGNVGDDLIHLGAHQLFQRHQIRVVESLSDCDQVVLCGGGNWGIWNHCDDERRTVIQEAIRLGKEIILYPQSFYPGCAQIGKEFSHAFVRERLSQSLMPGVELAPDTALAVVPKPEWMSHVPKFECGVFLRNDLEGKYHRGWAALGDCKTLVERDLDAYFELAGAFEHVITDRLHFAVASLILGRKTTLLPNSYHKNRGMWETWLADLGCKWSEYPPPPSGKDTPHLPINLPLEAKKATESETKRNHRIGMVLIVHDEEKYLEANLRYHHSIGVDHAWVFLDRCSDRSREIAESFPWVTVLEKDSPAEKHHFRTHQVECMDLALRFSREQHCEWLLHVDPDEFVYANNEGLSLKEKASLNVMLDPLLPHVTQVIFETREAIPVGDQNLKAPWMNDYFICQKNFYPKPIYNPISQEYQSLKGWIGHALGKTLIRTSAKVQAYNAHQWTVYQGADSEHRLLYPLRTVQRGWHAHFLDFSLEGWLKKYRSFGKHFDHWPNGKKVEFPKGEWTEYALNSESIDSIQHYLERHVLNDESCVKAWCETMEGIYQDDNIKNLVLHALRHPTYESEV